MWLAWRIAFLCSVEFVSRCWSCGDILRLSFCPAVELCVRSDSNITYNSPARDCWTYMPEYYRDILFGMQSSSRTWLFAAAWTCVLSRLSVRGWARATSDVRTGSYACEQLYWRSVCLGCVVEVLDIDRIVTVTQYYFSGAGNIL